MMEQPAWKRRVLDVNGKKFHPFKDVLVLDIETSTINRNKGIGASNAKLKIWGAYSYNTGKLYFGRPGNIQKLIKQHRIVVGHNLKDFDIPVLKRDMGADFDYKIILDILEILRNPPSKGEKEAYKKKGKKPISGKGRAKIIGEFRLIGMKDHRLPNLKLGTIAKHGYEIFGDHPVFGKYFTEYKDEDFDYEILNKKDLTEDEWKYIKEYLRKDIVVTKNIFEFLEKYFESFADNLPEREIEKLTYMHSPTGSYFYKAICHDLGLEEKYGDVVRDKFIGAKVLLPKRESFGPEDGDGYCIDWASQHPHNIWSANLATPVSKCKHKVDGQCPNPYSGDGKIFKLLGTYCGCELGEIEKWLRMMYFKRTFFKRKYIRPNGEHVKFKDCKVGDEVYFIGEYRNLVTKKLNQDEVDEAHRLWENGIDPKEYSVKIIINSGYGVLSSSIFESTYNETTGPDTTLMSQQSTGYMVNWMKDHGYIVAYGDTDSCYIIDPFKDEKRMNMIMAGGVDNIRDVLPFADMTYNMDVDAEFTHIFFFQDESDKAKRFKKKNYLYITKDGKVKLLGLPVLKNTAPKLAKKVYSNYLEPEIKRTKNIKFDKDWLAQIIEYEVGKDPDVLVINLKVNPAAAYASESQLQAQVSKKYANGRGDNVKLIKHKRKGYGVGLGKHYCNLEEAKKLSVREYDLDTVWKTLDPFIKKDKQMGLGEF